jgi:uracil-DNA glycosylase
MPRITGVHVPARFPDDDSSPVRAMLFGEAPGPRGADKSRIPFFGDRAGVLVYGALVRAGMCELTRDGEPVDRIADLTWDGERLRRDGVEPHLHGAALSNSYDACPTDDGHSFRAPSRAEVASAANVARLERELGAAVDRGLSLVVTLGRAADGAIGDMMGMRDVPFVRYVTVRHPSAQALLFAPDRKGRKLGEMERAWEDELVKILKS